MHKYQPERNPKADESLSRAQIIEDLAKQALYSVSHKYGLGSAERRPYHDTQHTIWVADAAVGLAAQACQNDRISPGQRDLILIAGAYHDVVQEIGADDNERQSAAQAARAMRSTGIFDDEEIALVEDAILGTKVQQVSGGRIVQSAEGRSYLAKLLADADLSTFGAPTAFYWDAAQRFFTETNPGVPMVGAILRQFLQQQVQLVSGHKYYTDEARQKFNNQPTNIDFLTSKLTYF